MSKIQVGVIREGKVPADKRVPLSPEQCVRVQELFPNVEISVESSVIRAYKDSEYTDLGINVSSDISSCAILLGVKEVPIPQLIPNKTYFFFSHTYKKQPYNRDLLQAILDKKIRLIDYEVLKDANNQRIIGFGRYAGIVGCYNAFRTYGLKTGLYSLKPAHECYNRAEMEAQLNDVKLPKDFKIVLTGFGRVGNGAREVLALLPIKEVQPADFLTNTYDEPVFSQLNVQDYFGRKDGEAFDKSEFYSEPSIYCSTFPRYLKVADVYVSCHFWSDKSPFIATREDFKNPENKVIVVADVSADIDGPIGCTLRPSTVADPIYGYNPMTEKEDDYKKEGVIAIMAIDNLPCELPRDASEFFGEAMIQNVFPPLFTGNDPDRILDRASETDLNGNLTPEFEYLQSYLESRETV
jgi:saccharopine dehydrogenase (NAD+, L-lysine forming)